MKHFKFLKTVMGKGAFNLFLASMFLVGSSGVWGWLMFGAFAFFGVFFLAIGFSCIKGVTYDDSDIKKGEVAANARSSLSKSNSKGSSSTINDG